MKKPEPIDYKKLVADILNTPNVPVSHNRKCDNGYQRVDIFVGDDRVLIECGISVDSRLFRSGSIDIPDVYESRANIEIWSVYYFDENEDQHRVEAPYNIYDFIIQKLEL